MAANYEPIMLPDIEEIQAEREEKIQRDLTFFSRALSFFVYLPKPKRQKRTNINRDYYGAHERLVAAYFSDNLMFPASLFEDRFRMGRSLFTGIVEEVTLHCAFFREKEDCTGKLGISPLIKCTSTIRQLAYDTVLDTLDEYLKMCHDTSRQYPFILLEVVTSQDLWIWHVFFGVSGANNDINVTQQSPLLSDLKMGKAPEVPFVANDATYPWGYYLCDGIYPEWVPFVKSVTNLADDDHKRLRYKAMHEAARKDVERGFGVLKKKWAILATHARAYIKDKLENIMYTCTILHNMIINDSKEAISSEWHPEEEHQPDDLIRSDEQSVKEALAIQPNSTIFEATNIEPILPTLVPTLAYPAVNSFSHVSLSSDLVAPSIVRTSWTNTNLGRRFYCERCGIIDWYDPEMCPRSIVIIPGLLRSMNALQATVSEQANQARILKLILVFGPLTSLLSLSTNPLPPSSAGFTSLNVLKTGV
ncbi:ALP1-like protein [Tanacetum coccineum]